MLRRAAEEHGLDLTRCAVVGDVGATDMLAAHAVGAIKVLVRTGWGESSLGPYRDRWAGVEPDYVAENLLDAARWLIVEGASLSGGALRARLRLHPATWCWP